MRSSFVKAIAALTIATTLVLATPTASAHEARTRDTNIAERGTGPGDRAIRAIRKALRGLIGGISVNSAQPTIPIPVSSK